MVLETPFVWYCCFFFEWWISILLWEYDIGDAIRRILLHFAKWKCQFYYGNMALEAHFVRYCCILQNENVYILRWEYDIGNAIRPILLHFAKCRCLFSWRKVVLGICPILFHFAHANFGIDFFLEKASISSHGAPNGGLPTPARKCINRCFD